MEETKPHFASSQNVHIDEAYASWIEELKGRYKKAQIKSAVKVNSEQLLFNWQLGRDLVVRRAEEHWGAGVVEQVSLDLKAAFPKAKGFSTTNLWNMKKWYIFYSSNKTNPKLQQLVAELQTSDNKQKTKLQQLGAEIQEAKHSPKMGVASYDKVRIKKIREALPSEEDLSRQLQLFENKRK